MKRAIVATALAVTLGSAAAETDELTLDEAIDRACQRLHEFAGAVMEKRQDGISITRLIDIVEGKPVLRSIVMEAYKESRWHTDRSKRRAVEDFQTAVFLECQEVGDMAREREEGDSDG